MIRPLLIVIVVLITTTGCAASNTAAPPIRYHVDLTAPQTQMVDVSIRIPQVNQPTIDLSLPTWRIGRYVILDPAGTVREVRAADQNDAPLPIEKVSKSTWRVTCEHATEVVVQYRIYANSIADRTRHVDDSHAFLSGTAVFMYSPERRADPIEVAIDAPADWAIASGLELVGPDGRTLFADNYDVLVDSPLEIGVHDRHTFDVDGLPHEIVIWPAGIEYDIDRMADDFAAIVRAGAAVFGGVKPYDRYVFLIHAGAGGGGTEHLNSTIMQTSRASIEGSLENNAAYKRFLGLVSHEMFHTWNVKQLRPSGIHPYDYQEENYSKLFWVAEGTTSYYDDLCLVRADLMSAKKFLDRQAGNIGSLRDRPGARIQSLEASSFDAWIKFNRSSPDDVNSEVSFYSKGALISLLLDLQIRDATDNQRTLDDVMRDLYNRFPLNGPGFTPADMQDAVERAAGRSFDDFFAKYIRGTVDPDFESAFAVAGLELFFKPASSGDDDEEEPGDDGDGDEPLDTDADKTIPMKADLGISLSGSTVRTVRSDGPSYLAGVMVDDEILAMNGRRLTSSDLATRLKRMNPGDEVELTLFRRDALRKIRVTLAGKPDGKWTIRKVDEPTDLQKAVYESWLGVDWE